MKKEFNLSEKIHNEPERIITNVIPVEDVKEFIKLLKEEFWAKEEKEFIDKIAGEELTNVS